MIGSFDNSVICSVFRMCIRGKYYHLSWTGRVWVISEYSQIGLIQDLPLENNTSLLGCFAPFIKELTKTQ